MRFRRSSCWSSLLIFWLIFLGIFAVWFFLFFSNEVANFCQILNLYQSSHPDSVFFFKVGKIIETHYYYTSPAPMESLPIFWQRTKLAIQKNPEKNDSLIFAGLSQFCNLFVDGHTYFLNPTQTIALFKRNQFTGIGIILTEADSNQKEVKSLRIFKILPNSPAEKAELKPGDFILAVDQKPIKQFKSINEVTEAIHGQEGTEIKLTIWRKGWKKPKIISLNRAKIFIHPVNWRMIDDIAYLELKDFNSLAVEEFDKAISEILKKRPKAIILDLRDNLGGTLKSVKQILDYWVYGLSFRLKTRQGEKKHFNGFILRKPKLRKIKTIILTNSATASASELMIGALKDYNLVILVGEKTYGKGCYQIFMLLPFGTALGITKGLWLTPKGNCIDKKGFTPDIEVKFNQNLWLDEGIDTQLQKALEILK